MKELMITQREAGQRFDRFLLKYMPEVSPGFLHKMMRKKNIKLNGKKAEGREKLREGDRIEIFFSDETLEKFRGRPEKSRRQLTPAQESLRKKVRILYASKDILVFHKPVGMLTQKAKKEDDSLNDYLIDYCVSHKILSPDQLSVFRPSVANRLDRNTSGIVLAGISIRGLQELSSMLKKRTIGKYYLCLVEGEVTKDRKIDGYLTKDEKNNKVTLHKNKVPGASQIQTEIHVVKANPRASLLKIRLITGKSHQIRSHLASVGHPVFGDYKYGNRDFNNRIKWEDGINYQLLHSYELVVPKGEGVFSGLHIIDPVPEEFLRVQKRWGLEVEE